MTELRIRLSDEEKEALVRRAKEEGTTAGALIRRLIQDEPIHTAADLLREMESMMGDPDLMVEKRS